jgi:predicted RNA-binding Zn ribbon-like protein
MDRVRVQPAAAERRDEELLVALANTEHDGTDELTGPADLATWWQGLRGPLPRTSSTEAGLDALRDLRRTVQEVAGHHNGGPAPRGAGRTPLTSLALRPELSDGSVTLVPQARGDLAADVTAVMVAALLRAAGRPRWQRVKRCPGADCGWVFVDASRNASRRWCDMAGCGNRAKSAAFRARLRRPDAGACAEQDRSSGDAAEPAHP